jgi:hypothetical protein
VTCTLTPDMQDSARHAEEIKRGMRRVYAASSRARRPQSFARMLALATEFWEEYDDVNQRLCPWDPVYSGTRAGITLATTTDACTLTAGSTAQLRVLEAFMAGESAASAVERLAMQRSTGGATPTNQTPEKASTRSPAAVATFATGWTTQPTLSGNPFAWLAANTFGGSDRWVPVPGEELYLVNSEQLSLRSNSGTSVVSIHLIWEEL